MATRDFIKQDRLKELIHYEPSTGVFTWLGDRGGRSFRGKVAGSEKDNGYREITVDGFQYLAHRLAWLYVNGTWPSNDIDHINGDKSDNRIDNLRDVFPYVNLHNTSASSKNNATKLTGVAFARNKYRAEIRFKNKRHYIGVFDSPEAASKAYQDFKQMLLRLDAGE